MGQKKREETARMGGGQELCRGKRERGKAESPEAGISERKIRDKKRRKEAKTDFLSGFLTRRKRAEGR